MFSFDEKFVWKSYEIKFSWIIWSTTFMIFFFFLNFKNSPVVRLDMNHSAQFVHMSSIFVVCAKCVAWIRFPARSAASGWAVRITVQIRALYFCGSNVRPLKSMYYSGGWKHAWYSYVVFRQTYFLAYETWCMLQDETLGREMFLNYIAV